MTESRPRPRRRGAHRRPAPLGWRVTRTLGAVTVLSLPAILFLNLFLVLVSLFPLVGAATRLTLRVLRTADQGSRRPAAGHVARGWPAARPGTGTVAAPPVTDAG